MEAVAARAGRLGDRLHARAEHHHDALGRERGRGVEHMVEHRFAGHFVQHLGSRRFEAGSLAGGQHDDGELSGGHQRSGRVLRGPEVGSLAVRGLAIRGLAVRDADWHNPFRTRPEHATAPVGPANHLLLQLVTDFHSR
jgi:hypothetical protein